MILPELIVAWRYLRARRREKFISVTAIFSFLGLALGVATLIIVTSVMNGFREEFSSKIMGFNGHLTAYVDDNEENIEQVVKQIEAIKGVKSAIPVIERHALSSNGRQIRGALVCGISKENLAKYKLVSDNITLGNIDKFNDENSVFVGSSLLNIFHISSGTDLTVLTPEFDETGLGMFPIKKTFNVVGAFKTGMHDYDSNAIVVPIKMAQALFNVAEASNILIFADDAKNIQQIKEDVSEINNLTVVDWMQNNSAFMNAVKVERNVMFLILTLITLVASFNIISSMIMLVKDKERDIAILKTLGFSSASITRIFFMIGSCIGVLGTLIGAIGGILFAENIDHIRKWLEGYLDTNLFAGEVYFLTNLPSSIDYFDVSIIVIFALIISGLATIYPSRKAGKLAPAEVLKYE